MCILVSTSRLKVPSHVQAFKCLIFSQGDHGDVRDLIPENEEHELKSGYEVCHFCLVPNKSDRKEGSFRITVGKLFI